MKRLMVFDHIEYEVEHPLYLARIQKTLTDKQDKISLNEFEVKTVPVWAVMVHYLPKFDRQMLGDSTAYRVLYEVSVVVGESHSDEELLELTRKAQFLAQFNPDPANWKEV